MPRERWKSSGGSSGPAPRAHSPTSSKHFVEMKSAARGWMGHPLQCKSTLVAASQLLHSIYNAAKYALNGEETMKETILCLAEGCCGRVEQGCVKNAYN